MGIFGIAVIAVGIIAFYSVIIALGKFMAWGLGDDDDEYTD